MVLVDLGLGTVLGGVVLGLGGSGDKRSCAWVGDGHIDEAGFTAEINIKSSFSSQGDNCNRNQV